jgi:O-antigen ligase
MLTLAVFLLGYFAGLALAIWRAPIWGLFAYLLAFYVHPPSRWWGAALPDLRWSLLAAAVTLIAIWIHRGEIKRPLWLSHPLAILFVAYVALMWIQIPWVLDRDLHAVGLEYLTKYVLAFYFVYRICDSLESIKLVLLAHVAGCFFLGWQALGVDVSGRLDGIGGPGINNANTLAMQLGTGLTAAALLIFVYRDWVRWVAIAMAPFIVNTIVLTQTRAAFVALLAAGLVIWAIRPRMDNKVFYTFAALGVVLFTWLAQDYFWERMRSVSDAVRQTDKMDSSAESRIYIIKAQWQMALDFPAGTGFRGTATLSPKYLEERWLTSKVGDVSVDGARSSHNTFMTTLVEQGFLGAALYLILWFLIARTVFRLYRENRAATVHGREVLALNCAIAASLTVVFVAGAFADFLNAEVQYWLIAMLAALSRLPRDAEFAPVADPAAPAEPVPQPETQWYRT